MYVLLSQRIRHSYCSDLLKFIPNQRIPQAVPWLQEFSRKRKLSLAGACLKPTYPMQRKEYPHSSCRIVLSHTGIKKGPAASLLQDLFKTATTYSPTCAVPSA